MSYQEVLFYGEISNFTVSSFINRIREAKDSRKPVKILANSMGGDPDPGYGMIKTIRDFPFKKKMSVHGSAYSMMAFACLYVNDVECIDQSKFLFHRAAAMFREDEQIPAMRELLVTRNEDLRRAMEERLDIDAFERISGVTLDQLFSMDDRIDVILNAEEAQEIGLVSEVISLPAVEMENINSRMMAASAGVGIHQLNIPKMKTLEELKEKHPELYAQAIEAGKKEAKPADPPKPPAEKEEKDLSDDEKLLQAGIEKERQRVAAWQVYAEVDAKKVSEGINSGKEITAADTQELLLSAAKKNFAGALQKGTDTTGDAPEEKPTDLPEELGAMAETVTASLTKKYKKAS